MSLQPSEAQLARKYRNRIRLLALFTIYPLWKTLQYMSEGNRTMAIVMGISTLVYIAGLLYYFARTR